MDTSHWTTNAHSSQSESKTKYADNAVHCFVFPSNSTTSYNTHAAFTITGQTSSPVIVACINKINYTKN